MFCKYYYEIHDLTSKINFETNNILSLFGLLIYRLKQTNTYLYQQFSWY